MNKIEKIQAKIDRMLDDICEADGFVQKKDEPRYDALAEVLDFIDTLEEEPDKSLEEAAEEYQSEARRHVLDNTPIGTAKDAFIAGAQWQEKCDEETIKTAEDHAFLAGADWQLEKIITLIQSRLSEIIGDAQPKPALRAKLRELIEKIKEDEE